jgi:hypothetical protein
VPGGAPAPGIASGAASTASGAAKGWESRVALAKSLASAALMMEMTAACDGWMPSSRLRRNDFPP